MDPNEVTSTVMNAIPRDVDIDFVIESFGRVGALVFLLAIIILLFRSARWSPSNFLLASVFVSWLLTITYSAYRFVYMLPPVRLHSGVYILITFLQIACIVAMVKEQNQVIKARKAFEEDCVDCHEERKRGHAAGRAEVEAENE